MGGVILSRFLVNMGLMMAKGVTKEALAARWAKLPAVVKKKLTKAVETNAKELERTVKLVAPKESGELAFSITRRDSSAGDYVRQTVKTNSKQAGAKKDYAVFIEYGTDKMEAQPFFFPTYRILRDGFKKRARSALRRGVKAAING